MSTKIGMQAATSGESPRDKQKRMIAEKLTAQMAEASKNFREHLDRQREEDAEFQRGKLMSRDERARQAKERLIGARKEFNDFKYSTDTTLAQAEREVNELVHRYHRDQGWE